MSLIFPFFRQTAIVLLLLLSVGMYAGTPSTLTVKYVDCIPKKLHLYEFDGLRFVRLETVLPKQDTSFVFERDVEKPSLFFVGQQEQLVKPVLFGIDRHVRLSAKCRQIGKAQVIKGDLNIKMEQLFGQVAMFASKEQGIKSKFARGEANAFKRVLKPLDDEKLAWYQQQVSLHPFLGKMAALNVYLSFQNTTLNYHSELEYFAREFFHYVDFSDKDYEQIPVVHDAFKTYAGVLSRYYEEDVLKQVYIDDMLALIPPDSKTYRYALGGVVNGFKGSSHTNYEHYGKKYVKKYKHTNAHSVLLLEKNIAALHNLDIGKVAPDFEQVDPIGEPIKLSDLRGKVVLVDFWASWCAPCRRANPHVKGLYDKYKDKGFEVLGVSLDKNRMRWLKAIDDDGLEWPQVSDLKGWQNAASQMYGVKSIPTTFLLDREGKIIGKKLRGAALDNKLKEIFGF